MELAENWGRAQLVAEVTGVRPARGSQAGNKPNLIQFSAPMMNLQVELLKGCNLYREYNDAGLFWRGWRVGASGIVSKELRKGIQKESLNPKP